MEQDVDSQINMTVNKVKRNEMSQETGNIDINSIMEKVRENIAKRRADGAYTDEDEILINSNENQLAKPVHQEFDEYLLEMQNNWNIENKNYSISSHRKIIGPMLIAGRNLVNGEIRRYIDPSLQKQSTYNINTIKIIEYILDRLQATDVVHSQVNNLQSQINDVKSSLQAINKHIEDIKGNDWSKIYNKEISEKDLEFNIDYHKEFISIISEYAKKSSSSGVPRLLEVGLGSSTITIHFSRSAYFCVGLDNNPMIIKRAMETNKKLGGYAKFILLDAFDLSLLKEKSFDVAFSQGTLEHFDNQKTIELLSNQLKVAKYVIFSVPSIYYPYKEFGNERKMTIEDWRSLLKDSKFNIIHLDYYQNKEQIACVITEH